MAPCRQTSFTSASLSRTAVTWPDTSLESLELIQRPQFFLQRLKAIMIVNLSFSGLKYKYIKRAVCSNTTASSRSGVPLLVSEYLWFTFKKLVVFPRSKLHNVMWTENPVKSSVYEPTGLTHNKLGSVLITEH